MRFDEMIGQERALGMIKAHLVNNRFCGAYLFSGAEGIGKKLAAKISAAALNCQDELNSPCGVCGSCLKIQKEAHPDLHIIQNGQAQIKIEDIREILRQANFRPYEGKAKVFIIDNAHKLNIEAANSLLKVLEEPPANVAIILITHKPQSIIKTVLSRCKMIKFSPLPRARLEDVLVKNYAQDRPAAHFLAYYAEGRLGLALRLKDEPLLQEKNKLCDNLLSLRPLDRNLAGQNKEQLHATLNILVSWFRDIYLIKAGLNEQEAINADRRLDLLKVANQYSYKQLDEIIWAIGESALYLEKNINSKLLIHNLGAQLWKA
jgi:DNA polymerase III subunit delta'